MEVGLGEVEEEEMRSARIGRKEDLEEAERERRKEKAKSRGL